MLFPTASGGRRPPVYLLVAAFIFAIFVLSSIYDGFFRHHSVIRKYVGPNQRPPWLILTISTAPHLQRRHIIRSTWQRLFHNTSMFETKFVISDPGPLWHDLIKHENETYGDILMLHHDHENHKWANSVKTLETLKWLVERKQQYTFVSKMDEDSFLDPKTFWKHWLQPRIDSGEVEKTYIGRKLQADYPMMYGSGQFYTLSWDLVELLVDLYQWNHINDEHEDVLTGRLMYEAQIPYNLTILPVRVAFDYREEHARGDGTAWAPQDQDVDHMLSHAVAPGAINPHLLKEDEDYLKVASCYDKKGLKVDVMVDYESIMEEEVAWTEWKGTVKEHPPVPDW